MLVPFVTVVIICCIVIALAWFAAATIRDAGSKGGAPWGVTVLLPRLVWLAAIIICCIAVLRIFVPTLGGIF